MQSFLGAGGMGEVYRALDTRLKRQVAIKVLPASVAEDAVRLARFQREAEVLALLNHPHIAAVYGLEEMSAGKALVMELVEGQTLADRIAHAPIPIDETLAIARQIAEALEAAHERGIVHRDLKPANIIVREDGAVKVLDFGLAKLAESRSSGEGDPLDSPTITSGAMTGIGLILGTAAYMSPEQARGRAVDKRTDVWAFGAVLYEMLARRRAFEGDSATDTIAAVVKSTPDWSALPPDVPPHVVTLIQRCLEKDRKLRIGDMAVARFLLTHGADLSSPLSPTDQIAVTRAPIWRRVWPLAVAAGLAGVAIGWFMPRTMTNATAPIARLQRGCRQQPHCVPIPTAFALAGRHLRSLPMVRPLSSPQHVLMSNSCGFAR
jgi:serine/threonine protein kinase